MLRRVATLAAFGICLGVPALAGDLFAYPPPPQGSAFYAASSVVTGDVSLGLGWLSASGSSSGMVTLDGRVNVPLHDDWNIEPDFGVATFFNPAETSFGGVVHLYKRLPQSAVGIFGGAEVTSGHTTDFIVGAEGALYTHPNSIVGGQIALISGSSSSVLLRGYWDYFFDPDLKATIDISWLSAYAGSGGTFAGTAGLTKRFAGTQISGFLSATLIAGGTSGGIGRAGLTWNFDPSATTQYDHDRLVPFDF